MLIEISDITEHRVHRSYLQHSHHAATNTLTLLLDFLVLTRDGVARMIVPGEV